MDYNKIRDEYLAFKQANPQHADMDLSAYAAFMDSAQGTSDRATAYEDSWFKQASGAVDRVFRPAGNDLANYVGKPIDAWLGTESIGQDVMRGTPRALAEGVGFFLSGGTSLGANLGLKAASLGSAALGGAANNDANPLVGAVTGAAALPAGRFAAGVGERLAANAVTKGGTAFGGRATEHIANFLGGSAGEAVSDTALLNAESLASSGEFVNPFTKEYVTSVALGQMQGVPGLLVDTATRRGSVAANEARAAKVAEVAREAEKTAGLGVLRETLNKGQELENLVATDPAFRSAAQGATEVNEATMQRAASGDLSAVDSITDPAKVGKDAGLDKTTQTQYEFSRRVEGNYAEPQRLEVLAKLSAKELDDPVLFTSAVAEANATLRKMWDQQLEAIQSRARNSDEAFFDEAREGAYQDSPDVVNPLVVEMLNKEGLIQFDEKWFRARLEENVAKTAGSTNSLPVAWERTVNQMTYKLQELAETAKVKKMQSIEPEKTVREVQNEKVAKASGALNAVDADTRFYGALEKFKSIEPELATRIEQQLLKHYDDAQKKPKSQYASFVRIFGEAMETFDPASRTFQITKPKDHGGRTVTQHSIDELFNLKLKKGKAERQSQKSVQAVSMDVITENRASKIKDQLMHDADLSYDNEAVQNVTAGLAAKAGEGAELMDLAVDLDATGKALARTEVENALPPSLPQYNENLTRLREVINNGSSAAVWSMVLPHFRGLRKLEQRRNMLGLAFQAKLEGLASESALRFAKLWKGKDSVSYQDIQDSLRYWNGPEGKAAFDTLLNYVKGDKIDTSSFRSLFKGLVETPFETPGVISEGIYGLLENHYRAQGMLPEVAAHFAIMGKKLVDSFGHLGNLTSFGKLNVSLDGDSRSAYAERISEQLSVMGLASTRYVGKDGAVRYNPLIAIAAGHKAKDANNQPVFNFLMSSVAAHEMFHVYAKNYKYDLTSTSASMAERARVTDGMFKVAEKMTEVERYATLRTLFNAIVPKEFSSMGNKLKEDFAGYLAHGASSAEEYIATYLQFFSAGLVGGGKSLSNIGDILNWEKPEVANFVKGIYRDVSDATDGLAAVTMFTSPQALSKELVRVQQATTIMQYGLNTFFKDLKKSEIAQKELLGVANVLQSGNLDALDNATVVLHMHSSESTDELMRSMGVNPALNAKAMGQALEETFKTVYNPDIKPYSKPNIDNKYGVANKLQDFWTRNFALFSQAAAMTGSSVAKDASNAVLSNANQRKRLMDALLSPWTTRNSRGDLEINPGGALNKVLSGEDSTTRDAVNDIGLVLQEWQDRTNRVNALKRNPQLPPNLAAYVQSAQILNLQNTGSKTPMQDLIAQGGPFVKAITPILQKLHPVAQGTAIATLDRLLLSYQTASAMSLQLRKEDMQMRLAKVVMAGSQLPYDQAQLAGQMFIEAAFTQSPQALAGLQAQFGQDPRFQALWQTASVLVQPLKKIESYITERPYFMSEQRPGDYVLVMQDATGKHYFGARDEEHAREIEVAKTKQGLTKVELIEKGSRYGENASALPVNVLEEYTKLESAAFQKVINDFKVQNANNPMAASLAGTLEREFNPAAAVQKSAAENTVKKFEMRRQLKKGRESLDYLEAFEAYANSFATNYANRGTKNMVELIKLDKRMAEIPGFVGQLDTMMQAVFTPNDPFYQQLKSGASAMFLAGNVANALIEPTQQFTAVAPMLVRDGVGVKEAYTLIAKNAAKAVRWTLNPIGANNAPITDPTQRLYRKFVDESPRMSAQLEDLSGDYDRIVQNRARKGLLTPWSAGKMVGNLAYQALQYGMKAYSIAGHLNSKATFLSGLEVAFKRGYTEQQAYNYAKELVFNTNFTGGKANRPAIYTKLEQVHPALGLAGVLQTYSLGMTTLMGRLGIEAIAKNPQLTPGERAQARKAFGLSMMAQTSLAGVLGLPFAAAGLTILEKMFNVEANAALREAFASLGGDDEELGGAIADMATNGLANQLFGLDVSGKTGLSSIMGTSAYSGFNLADLGGPVPGLVSRVVKAIGDTAAGDIPSAATELLPSGFRNTATLAFNSARYGQADIRDKAGNLILQPSKYQQIMYALGFQPAEVRRYKQVQQLLNTSERIASDVQDKQMKKVLSAYAAGNINAVHEYVGEQLAADPTLDMESVYRTIADKILAESDVKDLMHSGSRANAKNREALMSTFPVGTNTARSEYERLVKRQQILASFGVAYTPNERSVNRAMSIDAMRSGGLSYTSASQALDQWLQ